MTKAWKPMLACDAGDAWPEGIKLPAWVSPKLDGVRCTIVHGQALSRTGKLIPNLHIRSMLNNDRFDGFDGELMVEGGFNATQSAVMSIKGEPTFKFFVFDVVPLHSKLAWAERFCNRMLDHTPAWIVPVPHFYVETVTELLNREQEFVDLGYEGIMIRHNGVYKHGRSTLKEGLLLKHKRFHDDEARVIRFEQLVSKTMGPLPQIGALIGVMKDGQEVRVGTGFTRRQREQMFMDFPAGQWMKFQYQELTADGLPRFPSFIGFRDKRDM